MAAVPVSTPALVPAPAPLVIVPYYAAATKRADIAKAYIVCQAKGSELWTEERQEAAEETLREGGFRFAPAVAVVHGGHSYLYYRMESAEDVLDIYSCEEADCPQEGLCRRTFFVPLSHVFKIPALTQPTQPTFEAACEFLRENLKGATLQ